MEKIEKIIEIIKNGTTFSGLDIEIDQKKLDKVSLINREDFNPIEGGEDLFSQFQNSHSARGVRLKDIKKEQLDILKDCFGVLCNYKLNEIKQYDVTILTHIDKKTTLEKSVEATFNLTGGAIAAPGALVAMAGEKIIEAGKIPITLALMSSAVTVPTAIFGAVSLGVGSAIAMVPKLVDKITDKFNGDERDVAIEMAKNIENYKKDLSNVPNVETLVDKIKDMRKSDLNQSNSIKPKS